jgi:hypothetical protein
MVIFLIAVSFSVVKPIRLSPVVPEKDFSQPSDVSSKSVRRGDTVLKGSHQTVPAHLVGDVIPVGKQYNTDLEIDPILSPDHYIGVSFHLSFNILFCYLIVIISFLLNHIVIFYLLHIVFFLFLFLF